MQCETKENTPTITYIVCKCGMVVAKAVKCECGNPLESLEILSFLGQNLIEVYPQNSTQKPVHLIAYWRDIFAYVDLTVHDNLCLRRMCHLFKDSLKAIPKGMYTEFPHPNHTSVQSLIKRCHELYEAEPTKAPVIFFIKKGRYDVKENYLHIQYPMKIMGAGQDKTFIQGGGFRIVYSKYSNNEDGKRVELSGMTVCDTKANGLRAAGHKVNKRKGLFFLCDRMTFTRCGSNSTVMPHHDDCARRRGERGRFRGGHGVKAKNTKGRLINCVITQCEGSGIYCSYDTLIELEGSQTKVDGNNTSRSTDCYGGPHGLTSQNTSCSIHLLFPLTKESVSTNHHNGQNYASYRGGDIETVESFSTADENDENFCFWFDENVSFV